MQQKEIRWKTSLSLFPICLCFLIFLTSCDTGRGPGIPEFQKDTSDTTPGDISDSLVARIYFDATLSMQGFVVPGSTRYTQICPYLESVIVSGWTDGKAKFFRFGEQVESINRGTYLQAGTTDFYEDETINRETFIQKIIDHEGQFVSNQVDESNPSEKSAKIDESSTSEESTEVATSTEEVSESQKEKPLVVIVTDLFQDRSDINLLVTQLKEKYIKNGLEVGLFGLRSQFDGIVYDTGIGREPLPHKSNPQDPKTFRPFYLLVLGRHADIAHYFNRLIANGFPKAQTIIFSRYLVNPLLSFDGAPVVPTNLNPDNFVPQDPCLKQYEIVDDSKSTSISTKLTYVPLPHAMSFDSDTLEVSITAKDKLKGETKENPEAQKCLDVTSTLSKKNEDDSELDVSFKLDSPRSLPSKRVYFYEVTLRPGIDKYQAPKWCSDWDMGAERDGAKTLNLVNFVRDLSQVTARMQHPKIAQFHCYIERR